MPVVRWEFAFRRKTRNSIGPISASKLPQADKTSVAEVDAPITPVLPTLVFFGHDSNEPTVIKRMSAFAAAGARVIAFTFTRARPGLLPSSRFENVHLGFTKDRNYLRRLPGLIYGLLIALTNARTLRRANVIYARNIDMALIALFAKNLSGSRATLAYEVLDIQRIFFGHKPVNNFVRFTERLILSGTQMLVVSTPDFMSNYFRTGQKYSGPWRLLENKIAAGQLSHEVIISDPPAAPPWVIGWFGRLRCRRSLDILCRIADQLGEKVFIDIRGLPSEEDLPTTVIKESVAKRTNMAYGGAYSTPGDLPRIYGTIHFSWCIDFLDARTNSDWLLPNRLYEGGAYAVPALVRAGTATARKVDAEGHGFRIDEPLELSAVEFLEQMDNRTYQRQRATLKSLPRSTFVDIADTRDLLYDLLLEKAGKGHEDQGDMLSSWN